MLNSLRKDVEINIYLLGVWRPFRLEAWKGSRAAAVGMRRPAICAAAAGLGRVPFQTLGSSFINKRNSVMFNTKGCWNTVWHHSVAWKANTYTHAFTNARTHKNIWPWSRGVRFAEITFDFRTDSWTNFQVSKVFLLHSFFPASPPGSERLELVDTVKLRDAH